MINREGYYVTETERECTRCGTIFKRTNRTVALCPSCNSERVKTSRTPERKMWERARFRAKTNQLEFTLKPDDIKIPERCPYLDIELKCFSGRPGGEPYSPALDRIDSSKGYTPDNVQVISHLANMMKSSATKEQLVLFSKRILETFGED